MVPPILRLAAVAAVALVVAASGPPPLGGAAGEPPPAGSRDGLATMAPAADPAAAQARAWELLDRALRLHGGEAPPAGGLLEVELAGTLFPREQSRRSTPPFDPFPTRAVILFDAAGARLEVVEELTWPNFVARHRTVVTPQDAFEVDLSSGRVGPPYQEAGEVLARTVRRLPAELLAEVLATAAALRHEGRRELAGEPVEVVAALHRGERLDLFLDGSGRLVGYGRMVDEPMLGDAYETVRYAGEVTFAGRPLPAAIERRLEGIGLSSRLEVRGARWVANDEGRFARPVPAVLEADPGAAAAPSPAPRAAPPPALEELAPGVWLAAVPGRPDYRSLVVERAAGLILVEAPLGEDDTERLLALLDERFPGRPVEWVVATHHHFDHSAGVPAAVRGGAELVTTPGNAAFFRRAATAARTVRGGPSGGPEPRLLLVADRATLPGEGPVVEVVAAGPTPHVEETLLVYLPEHRLLFQGDFVRFPLTAGEPLRPEARLLARRVEELGLEVERVAGVHGEVGSLEALRAAAR